MKKQFRKRGMFLFVIYILFLLYFLIFPEWYGRSGVMQEYHYNLVPFQEIKRFWNYRDQLGMSAFMNLLGNVVIFVPLGFLGAMASRHRSFIRTSLDGFLLSFVVEVFQLFARVGRFDVDDLILNTLGTILGYIIFLICDMMRRIHGTKGKRA